MGSHRLLPALRQLRIEGLDASALLKLASTFGTVEAFALSDYVHVAQSCRLSVDSVQQIARALLAASEPRLVSGLEAHRERLDSDGLLPTGLPERNPNL